MWSDESEWEAPKRKRHAWSEEDEKELIKLWEQYATQLKECKRNSHIYKELSEKMNEKFSGTQIRVKLMNLCARYSHERKKIALRSEPSDWPLFDKVHEIYGRHKTYEFETTDGNSNNRTNLTFAESETLMESLVPEEDYYPAEKRQENIIHEQKDLLAHNHDFLNRKRKITSCSEEDTNTQQSYHSTKTSRRFRSRIEEDDVDEKNSSTLSKLADTVNNVVCHIIKEDSGKSRNDPFYKLMDLYLLQLPERSQDTLKIKMLNMVHNKINDNESVQENDDGSKSQ